MLSNRSSFIALQSHAQDLRHVPMRDMFAKDPDRFAKFHEDLGGLLYDFSKNQITEQTLTLLCDLAQECEVEQKRDALFAGEKLNTTEGRSCLHTALRAPSGIPEIDDFVAQAKEKMRVISGKIRNNPQITDVVNIGVGGSDLGPRTVCEALRSQNDGPNVHFLSNVDGHSVSLLLEKLDPARTMFLVASKTFTTLETMSNARYARKWAGNADHFIALTSAPDEAVKFGIADEHILPMRDWVGGRFSLWSVIGLPIAIAIGFDKFEELLAGAALADKHFKETPLRHNIPVIMAMIDVWYRNIKDYRSTCILAYADCLKYFPSYVQQIFMESNGKSAAQATSPTVFGHTGTDSQHAFMQAFHQGTDIIPCEFILSAGRGHNSDMHHVQLNANALAQAEALMLGRDNAAEPHRHFDGNRPSTTIILENLSPYQIGLLMALYEHRVFVQGIIWEINSFDQWGVELGKTLAQDIIQTLKGVGDHRDDFDSSTHALINHLRKQL